MKQCVHLRVSFFIGLFRLLLPLPSPFVCSSLTIPTSPYFLLNLLFLSLFSHVSIFCFFSVMFRGIGLYIAVCLPSLLLLYRVCICVQSWCGGCCCSGFLSFLWPMLAIIEDIELDGIVVRKYVRVGPGDLSTLLRTWLFFYWPQEPGKNSGVGVLVWECGFQ